MTRHTTGPAVANPAVVRLSGPQGLVAAIPMYLGFRPADSLVLMCLRAPRGRVGPVARIDLFPPDASDPVRQLVGCAVRHADSVVVVCYHDGDRPPCLDTLLAALADADVPIASVLSVRDGLIRDADSAAAERADPGVAVAGDDDEQARTLAAATAMAGRQILPSRQALRNSIAGPRGKRLARVRRAITDRCDSLAEQLRGRPVESLRPALRELVDAAFARAREQQARSGSVSMTTACELIVLAEDVDSRDLLVARSVGANDPDVVPVLISVAGWCPDEDAAQICSVLAVAAYRYGDGALAQCAVDRALAGQPDHRLAHLMLSVMAAGLHPGELARMADIGAANGGDGDPDDAEDRDDERYWDDET